MTTEENKNAGVATDSLHELVGFKRPPNWMPPSADRPWFCEGCGEWIQCDHVTYEETHDPRNGGCGGDCV